MVCIETAKHGWKRLYYFPRRPVVKDRPFFKFVFYSIRRKGKKETSYIISTRALDSASFKYSILIKQTHP